MLQRLQQEGPIDGVEGFGNIDLEEDAADLLAVQQFAGELN